VAGLARDTRHYGLDEEMRPGVFMPFTMNPHSSLFMVLRSAADVRGLIGPVRRNDSPGRSGPGDVRCPHDDEAAGSLAVDAPRLLLLFGAFAAVAILLAVAGIYGVVSFTVSRRTREIGIRIALGARPGQVLLGVLGERHGPGGCRGGAGPGRLRWPSPGCSIDALRRERPGLCDLWRRDGAEWCRWARLPAPSPPAARRASIPCVPWRFE